MTKENNNDKNTLTPYENFSEKNGNLKRYLNLALKNTREIMKVLLPKIAVEIQKMIEFHINATKDQIKTDKTKIINEKAIREHIYSLVGYVAKEERNGAFETVVARAMHLAIMKVNTPNDIEIDEKNSKIFMVSRVATPFIEQKLQGQKGGIKKIPNTSNELVEINTGVIDTVHKIRTGKVSKNSKTKDAQVIANNFKSISKAFLNGLDKLLSLSSRKKVEFFDLVDEEVHDNLSNILTLMNSDAYTDMGNFSVDYEVSINGKDVIKKDNNKKIA